MTKRNLAFNINLALFSMLGLLAIGLCLTSLIFYLIAYNSKLSNFYEKIRYNFSNLGEYSKIDPILKKSQQFCLFVTQNPSGDKYKRRTLDANLSELLHPVAIKSLSREDLIDVGVKYLENSKELSKFVVDNHLKIQEYCRKIQASIPPSNVEYSILEITIRDLLSVFSAIVHLHKNQKMKFEEIRKSPLLHDIFDSVYCQRIPPEHVEEFRKYSKINSLHHESSINIDYEENVVVIGSWKLSRRPEQLDFQESEVTKVFFATRAILHSEQFLTAHGLYFCDADWLNEMQDLMKNHPFTDAWRIAFLSKLRTLQSRKEYCTELKKRNFNFGDMNPELSSNQSTSFQAPIFLVPKLRLWLSYLCKSAILRRPILFFGPLGHGRTATIQAFAFLRNSKFQSIQITPESSEMNLIGGMQPDAEELMKWKPGIVTLAAQRGSVLCLDSISSGEASFLERLNPLLETPPVLVVEGNTNNVLNGNYNIPVSDYFAVVSTMSSTANDQNQLTAALINRHLIIRSNESEVSSWFEENGILNVSQSKARELIHNASSLFYCFEFYL